MFSSIVVGTDGSQTAGKAILQAVDLALALRAKLHVVCAYEPVGGHRMVSDPGASASPEPVLAWQVNPLAEVEATLEAAASQARAAGVAEVEIHARQGDAADSILDVAEERGAELIIVGNKGMTGAERFLLGSVPNKVSHHAPCSVLIIRTA
ncbi:MAG: universal stress protein [Solirubrobacteraceae bacterium]